MTIPPRSAPLIETFNTHLMADATVTALATAREHETAEILDAIRRNLTVVPGPLQHVVVYAPRGFGKSFMTRLIQIETATIAPAEGRIIYVLLPEEQHNLTRSPHALLTYLTAKLADQRLGQNRSWTEAAFRWPRPDQEAALWDAAVRDLEAELDASLAGERGLVIAAIENFDTLLATLFKADPDEQRLRKWLGRAGNRLMLLATGTRTADIDYERPLFQAFQSVRLEPWSSDDCVAYFNRRRALEGKPALGGRTEAKARAIADFIGGNPRLAQLLGDVLETGDAMTVAGTMTALADRLADYYRRRIDDLPPLAQGLVDALIRGGEPCSATELATRVGAQQSDIARVMQDLRRADIIRGTPAADSRETMFRVVDRVFVHFYRLRQGNELVRTSPLLTILEFLQTFYTREEQREQAARYLDRGQPAEAMVFSRLVRDGERPGAGGAYRRGFPLRLRVYLAVAPDAMKLRADEIVALLDGDQPADLETFCTASSDDTLMEATIRGAIRAQIRCRMALLDQADHLLRTLLNEAIGDPSAITVAAEELGGFLGWERQAWQEARRVLEESAARCEVLASEHFAVSADLRRAWCLLDNRQTADDVIAAALADQAEDISELAEAVRHKAFSLAQLGRNDEAIAVADHAAALAEQAGDTSEQAAAFLSKAFAFGQLGRYDDAIAASDRAAVLAEQAGDTNEQVVAILCKAFAFGDLGRYEDAVAASDRAAVLAEQAGELGGQADAIRYKAFALGGLSEHNKTIAAADHAAALADQAGDISGQAEAIRYKAIALNRLGRYEAAIVAADRAAALADQTGDIRDQAMAIRYKVFALGQLGRHEDLIAAADRAATLAEQAGDISGQAVAIRDKVSSLGALGRHDAAIAATDRAAALADQAGDRRERARAIQSKAFVLDDLGRHEEAIAAANEAVTLAIDAGDPWTAAWALLQASESLRALDRLDDSWRAALAACEHARALQDPSAITIKAAQRALIEAAALSPRSGVIPFYRDWIELSNASPETPQLAPGPWLDTFVAAVMRAVAWSDFDLFTADHADWLGKHINRLSSPQIGQAIAGIFRDAGRAAGFEAARAVLPRLGRLLSAGDRGNQEAIAWLQPILGAFAKQCRDPGMLRDVAGLLDDTLAPDAAQVRALLQALADFDAGRGGEAGLTRIDPDVATWIRRIRNIPEEKPPTPAPAKPRGKRRG